MNRNYKKTLNKNNTFWNSNKNNIVKILKKRDK